MSSTAPQHAASPAVNNAAPTLSVMRQSFREFDFAPGNINRAVIPAPHPYVKMPPTENTIKCDLQELYDKQTVELVNLQHEYLQLVGQLNSKKILASVDKEKYKRRLVVLWDAENVDAALLVQTLHNIKKKYPKLKSDNLRFGFGFNERSLPISIDAVRASHNFTWHFKTSNTKNCADIQLVVFAMGTLLQSSRVCAKTYLIVSKDRDFLYLKRALEAAGRHVIIAPPPPSTPPRAPPPIK